MGFKFKVLAGVSLVVWTSVVVQPFRAAVTPVVQPFRAAETPVVQPSRAAETPVVQSFRAAEQKTTNDGVYTKAQADGAKKQFDKICADCHAFTVAAKKKPKDLPLGDDPFFEEWTGRPLSELVTLIALTMPNDGSAEVSENESLNLVAYILQQNGFRAGAKPLTKETASATVVVRR